MCKKKKSTRRKHSPTGGDAMGGFSEPAQTNPVTARLTDVGPCPADKLVDVTPPGGGPPTKCAQMSADDAIVLPTTGKAALKRVFLGIGWAATPGQRIDVDCCCAPYAKGVKVSADTVWYGNLRSRDVGEGAYKGYCTVKHSGDVLIGQQSSDDDGSGGKKQGTGGLEDLERIYVDLENLDDAVDALAFEANVYTAGLTFASLEHAYIRLVNADTNQELARCALGSGDGADDSKDLNHRVLLFAKMFRGQHRWVLHTVAESKDEELRHAPPDQVDVAMLPPAPSGSNADGVPIAEPVPQKMDRDEPSSVDTTGVELESSGDSKSTQKGKAAQAPKRSYLLPAVAIGTAAGVAAAISLFGPSSLSVDNMGSAAFTNGVDWGNLIPMELPTDCGCMHDCLCCGCNMGDVFGDGADVMKEICVCGPCFDVCELENPLESCCCVGGGPCGDIFAFAGGACGEIGNLCGDGIDGLGDCVSSVCGSDACNQLEGLVDVFDCSSVLSACGSGIGAVVGACSSCDLGGIGSAIGGACAQCQGAVSSCDPSQLCSDDCVKGVTECLNNCLKVANEVK